MASERSKMLLLLYLLGMGNTSAGEVFAVTSETQCAETLPFGDCLDPVDIRVSSSAIVCTNFRDMIHEAFTQDFYVNDQLQFTVDWAFQSGPKTLKERFENAVANGEEVIWTVNTAPGIAFNGITSETHHGIWRFSKSANIKSSFIQLSGSGFSGDGGSWGVAFTDNVAELGGWGHENKKSDNSSMCNIWYANGIAHSASGTDIIRNVMRLGAFQGTYFGGATTFTLEDLTTKAITELEVGDKIQTSDGNGNLGFSPVLIIPQNNEMSEFLKITTETGKTLFLTPGHLLPRCDGKPVTASKLVVGDCLLTVDGKETLLEITSSTEFGAYTAITKDKFIVVDGIITRPYAVESNPDRLKERNPFLLNYQQNEVSYIVMKFMEKFAYKTGISLRGSRKF